jgi:hypothetical protein
MAEQIDATNYEVSMNSREIPVGLDELTVLKTADELQSENPDFISQPIETQVEAVIKRIGGEILSREEIKGLIETPGIADFSKFFNEL